MIMHEKRPATVKFMHRRLMDLEAQLTLSEATIARMQRQQLELTQALAQAARMPRMPAQPRDFRSMAAAS